MLRLPRQYLLALLSILMLCQSVAAIAEGCLELHSPDSQTEQTIDACSDHGCQNDCCEAPEPGSSSCCDSSGCGGDCHAYCLCVDVFVTLAYHPPELDLAQPALASTSYRYTHYSYSDPEPQSLLRPPCA